MPGFNPMDVTTKRVLKKLGGDKETTEIKWDGNTDGRDSVPYQSVTFYKVSDRMFTPEELGKATYAIGDSIGTDDLSGEAIHVFDSSELGLPAGLFIGTLWSGANAPLLISGAAFEAGGFAIPSDGTYFATLPQFSMYLHKLSVETIHPIDPKFLPTPIVDFDELGLTNVVLELFNAGGGSKTLGSGDPAEIEHYCKAFPSDRGYIAKMTIPDMGVMNVNPVYTLTNEDGFRSAHFDSYIDMGVQLTKFYVRIVRMPVTDGSAVYLDVVVGFYA